MRIHVELFLHLRRFAPQGAPPHEVDLPEGATVADLVARLGIPDGTSKVVLVEGHLRSDAEPLRDGEAVTVFPPLEGG